MKVDARFGSPLPDLAVIGEHHELRPFVVDDLALIEEVARDEFIPSITSMPAPFTPDEGMDYIERQWSRQSSGAGWSPAIVDRDRGVAVGQIGL